MRLQENANGQLKGSSMNDRIFVVLCSYNSAKYIPRCLDSLLHSDIPLSIVVVDNASSDDSVSLLRAYGDKITLFPQKKNLGFGGGNNLGMRYAAGRGADYLFLLNMDTYVEPNTISTLLKIAKETPEETAFSPLAKTFSGKLDLSYPKFISGNSNSQFGEFISDLYEQCPLRSYYLVPFLYASALFFPASVYRKCGEFADCFYPAYYEDDELFTRMIHYGVRLAICPSAVYRHDTEWRTQNDYPPFFHLRCMNFFALALDPRISLGQYSARVLAECTAKSLFHLLAFHGKTALGYARILWKYLWTLPELIRIKRRILAKQPLFSIKLCKEGNHEFKI